MNAEQIKQGLESELMAEMNKRFVNRIITPKIRAEIMEMIGKKIDEYNEMLEEVQSTDGY